MAEIFLSASIQVLFEKLLSPDFINHFSRGEGVHTAVKKWTTMLMKIQAVLTDAEDKQITNRAVKIWLDELRDLAYDVEDILDEFATEALRRNLMAEPQASTSKIQSLIPTCCTSFKPSAVMFNFEMKSKMKEITARLEQIVTQKSQLELGTRDTAGGMFNRATVRRETTSLVAKSRVVGREKDKEAILEQLFSGEAGEDEVCVITIIGMGGVGKTTLTQLVYNDDSVKDYFDMKAWVCVSEDFDLIRLTKSILESFNFPASDVNNLNSLQERLKENLSKKKFLLVLDDVWHENYDDWTILRKPLGAGAPESKIVVTTRNQRVLHTVGTISSFPLKELSEDDCRSIFTQHALGTRGFHAHPNLKETGEEIVKRCKGLPLAAQALGGLLCSSVNLDEWKDVLNSTIWDLPEDKCGIIPALRLSYHHLPPHLKQCFAYCSILPKDYEFEEEELILLWMATGLVQQRRDESKQMEDIGGRYFRDLLSRSFFQISNINKSRYVMHDLINDLAQWVAGETCFRLEGIPEGKKQHKISKKARHSSYVGSYYDGIKKFEAFDEVKCLRTFLALSRSGAYLTYYVLLNLLPELRCLRVLSLRYFSITVLPNSIGDLKHLRYLDFSGTSIICLPKSISTLHNLQTLKLKNCSHLKKLPKNMENLTSLRLLDITNANSIKEMPPRVGKLTNLQKLSNFIVGNNSGGTGIMELMNLKHLRGTLFISRLENVIDAQEAREANLKDKQDLNVLTMGWSSEFNDSIKEEVEREVLDMLQPHKKLKELTIKCYSGTMLPTWVGDPSFSTLEFLRFENCVKCTSLPPLGQLPSLKHLCVERMNGINIVGLEFNGKGCITPFRSLETLSFKDMKEWTNWSPFAIDRRVEVFPCLRELSILRCPKLLGNLPDHLPSLEKLIINSCQQLAVSISNLPKLCELDIKECQEMVQRSTNHLDSLKSMVLSNVSEFTCLTEGLLQGLTKVEDVEIIGCNELTSLWQKEAGLLQNLTSLRRLKIKDCPKFDSLVAEEVEQQQQGLPCGLESLVLESCDSLEKLQGLNILTSLRALTIKKCREFVSFPETSLPSMLRELRIQSCDALKSLPLTHCNNGDSLEELHIRECPNLTFLSSRGELPASLKNLSIDGCLKLESVAERLHNNTSSLERIDIRSCESLKSLPEGLHNLTHLSSIQIRWCSSLVSFPDGGLPTANLRRLSIRNCEKLEALPDRMHHLTSLQQLEIEGCPGIVSFPPEGFPTSLTSLAIFDLNICNPLFEWGLHRLTSLGRLNIRGGCPDLVSFPEEEKGMRLPSSLTELTIGDFPNLEYLSSKRFQDLTSLKCLSIFSCPNLKSFSEVGQPPSLSKGFFQNLTSLECLSISYCPKLKSFPDEGLPPSLLELHITRCPLLKRGCKKDKGRDWPKIAHIPCVRTDGRFIYFTET